MTLTVRTMHAASIGLAVVGLLAIGAEACVHPAIVPAPVVAFTRWTIPLTMDDDVAVCVEGMVGFAGIDPADSFPLRCVSVRTIRAWIRAQRLADE
jgi:hypothetical protein